MAYVIKHGGSWVYWLVDIFTPATTGSSHSVLKTNATKLVSVWLEGPPKKKDLSDCAFMGDKILAKLFIRYNTNVPFFIQK
jgi:hypothetical protein